MSDAAPRPDAAPPRDAAPAARRRAAGQPTRFRVGALIAVAVVVGLILWLALRDTGGGSSSSSTSSETIAAASAAEIQGLASELGHPVFWLGTKKGYTYELRRQSNGTVIVRYLPQGANVGSDKPYLSVATYPFPNAYSALQALESQGGTTRLPLPGGIALIFAQHPNNVHLAYPGVNFQAEVFDPAPGVAKRLVTRHRLVVIGSLNPTLSGATGLSRTAMTASSLRAFVTRLGHPVYWAGPKKGFTYEVAQDAKGDVFIRYLPAGVPVGTSALYLTVGTYPLQNAFRATESLSAIKGARRITLSDGGLAVIDPKHPTNIHLAYPAGAYQVEVFDPSARAAQNVVKSGQVEAIG